MIFFNEVLFTSYCCIRYFHKRKKLYFIFSLDFSFVIFLWKRCLLGQTKRRSTLLTILQPPPDIPVPAYYILHKFPTPCLKPLTIITKSSILDVAAFLDDPPLIITFVEHTSGAGISSVLIPVLHFIDATTPEKGCVFLLYSFLKSK